MPKSDKDKTIFYYKTHLDGLLKFKRPLTLLGKFTGEIEGTNTLELGPKAVIEANICVKHLIVYGKIIGNVVASHKVELKTGSSLIGNIKTPNLEIDKDVIFDGQCDMQQTAPLDEIEQT